MLVLASGTLHQQEGKRLHAHMPAPALEYRFGDCHQNIGGFLLDSEPLAMPPVTQQGTYFREIYPATLMIKQAW